VLTRHDRKAGGEVGESGRGSTAWGGIADIIIAVRRHAPDSRPTVRVIDAVGRFDETPDRLIVELTGEEGYTLLGDTSAFAEREAAELIVKLLPGSVAEAMATANVLDKLADEHDVKRTVANEALAKLASNGIVRRIGEGKKVDPYRYCKLPAGEYASEIPSSAYKSNVAEERKPESKDCIATVRQDTQILSSAEPTYKAEERKLEPHYDISV